MRIILAFVHMRVWFTPHLARVARKPRFVELATGIRNNIVHGDEVGDGETLRIASVTRAYG